MTRALTDLPNCLIIGAAKAGTTSLFQALAGHPHVFASPVKEVGFFSHDDRFAQGLEWYQREYFRGAGSARVRLEASPAYLTWSDKVAERIRRSYDGRPVKLVAILRDPVTRAYSHYCHRVRLGHEPLSFAEALEQEHERLRVNWDELARTGNGKYGYFRAGCYASRLTPFFDQFDARDLCVLLQDDLAPDRVRATMNRLLGFLQLDESGMVPPSRLNAPTRPRSALAATVHARVKRSVLKTLYFSAVPAPARRAIRKALFAPAAYPPLAPDLAHNLRVRYAEDVRACAALVERDLTHWLPR
jgi:Sulfotransferase domain